MNQPMVVRKVYPEVPYSWPTRVLLLTTLSAFVIVWSVLALSCGYSYLWYRGARARLDRFAKRVRIPQEKRSHAKPVEAREQNQVRD